MQLDSVNEDNPVLGNIEKAVLRYTRYGKAEITISGWLLYSHTSIVILQFALPGSEICLARKVERPDIGIKYPHVEGSILSGFHAVLPLSDRSGSLQEVYFTAILSDGLIIAGALDLPEMFIQSSARNYFQEDRIPRDHRIQNTDPAQAAQAERTGAPVDTVKNGHAKSTSIHREEYQNAAHERLMKFIHSGETITFSAPEKPSISILLILHNKAEFTLDCLRSISLATHNNYEIIIIDNASTDYTKVLLSKIKGVKIFSNDQNLHFVKSVNQASQHSAGKNLLLLNNDACISPDSLMYAEETLAKNGVGAVGGRIVRLDGTLQEAGCVLLSNGGCYGYGVGEDPNDPRYLFERRTEFCSGTFLLTKRELFESLNGLDEDFAPAYYEEVDYCLRLRIAGYETRYDPRCLITHVVHGSSSKEEAIALLKENVITLREKHQELLSALPSSEESSQLFGRSALDKRKRILVIDDVIPFSWKGSGVPRSNRLLKAFHLLEADVTFYSCIPQSAPLNLDDTLSEIPITVECVTNPGKSGLSAFLKERKHFYDTIVVSRPHNVEFLNSILPELDDDTIESKIIYDAEALYSEREFRKVEIEKGIILTDEEKNYVRQKEIDLAKHARKITVVSKHDADKFIQHGHTNVELVSYGLPLCGVSDDFTSRKDIIFVGPVRKEDAPNYDAIRWFIQDVFPILKKEYLFSDTVRIYGEVNEKLVAHLQNSKIVFHGPQKKLDEIYLHARLAIAPMRIAAGIPIKVIEAASFGVPVVATDLVAELLGWEKQLEIAATSSAESFAYACHLTYNDMDIWKSLNKNAAKRIRDEYSEKEFLDSVIRAFF
jgi:O-antigen biosynthesis protein